jgi:hypothetical protein
VGKARTMWPNYLVKINNILNNSGGNWIRTSRSALPSVVSRVSEIRNPSGGDGSQASQAPPNERGGNRFVPPTATAPHLDSTMKASSRRRSERPLSVQSRDLCRIARQGRGQKAALAGGAVQLPEFDPLTGAYGCRLGGTRQQKIARGEATLPGQQTSKAHQRTSTTSWSRL